MTPDQRFARWVQIAIVALACLFIYFLAADLIMPLTPQAQMTRPVVKVAPRVSGKVSEVAVSNNQQVQPGQLLFRLDPEPFMLNAKQAELALEQAEQDNTELDASLEAATAEVSAMRAQTDQLTAQAQRLRTLLGRQHVSRQAYEDVEAKRLVARARLLAAQANVHEIQARRGALDGENLRLRQARNALRQARLRLAYSEIRAERSGVVSNLQLSPGAYLQAGAPVAALVEEHPDIIADFREKALRYVQVGTPAVVVFDARPGELFSAQVSHFDAGVREGQIEANGELAAPAQSERWVRDAQRQRLHIVLDQPMPVVLPTGAKATVQLKPFDNPFVEFLAALQIRFISVLHYVY
ncbi:MAG: HlyD family secretion protein [Gammaproteobacteria bacterium]|nr:HlyD family secretion protein [Gammaproteobacteria bacterium]MBU0884633.1 HlyD family secretion protein [Gammaproteobacteria bacterium]MBU1860426.1 HlyD family secretion protein [Gammaproteobacteria bacterium]